MKSLILLLPLFFTGCATVKPIRTAESVDLDRFMGDWYVVANIPTFLERDAWNALERYEMRDDGVILTTFRFNRGGPDGPVREFHPRGFVRDTESNAVWGMQFIWPFRAEYIISYVNEDYTETIIGRRQRDFLWIMARTPHIPEEDLERLIQIAVDEGYERERIQIVPHSVEQGETL
jgi:apolipoprotein D and lipocalin family protein